MCQVFSTDSLICTFHTNKPSLIIHLLRNYAFPDVKRSFSNRSVRKCEITIVVLQQVNTSNRPAATNGRASTRGFPKERRGEGKMG